MRPPGLPGAGEQRLGNRPQLLLVTGPLGTERRRKHPREHSRHVGVHQRRTPFKRKTRHRAGRVGTDARQGTQFTHIPRKCSIARGAHFARECVQVARPRVVAEPFPRFHHLSLRRARHVIQRRKPNEKPVVELHDA